MRLVKKQAVLCAGEKREGRLCVVSELKPTN
jgi:hypothetical protein